MRLRPLMLNESYVAKHSLQDHFLLHWQSESTLQGISSTECVFPKHTWYHTKSAPLQAPFQTWLISQHSLFHFWVFSGLLQKYNFPWDCCSCTCGWTQLVLPCLHSNGCSSTGRVHGPDLLRTSLPSLGLATLATSNYNRTIGKNGCISAFSPSQFIKAFKGNRRRAIRLLEHFKICPLDLFKRKEKWLGKRTSSFASFDVSWMKYQRCLTDLSSSIPLSR